MMSTNRTYATSSVLRWLALTVSGWLVYAVVRALWTVVSLGTPLFDWQWYVAVLVLIVVLSVRLVGPWPRGKLGAGVFVGLLIWLVVGYAGLGKEVRLSLARRPPVLISFWAPLQVSQMSDTVFQHIHKAGGRLYLAVGQEELSGDNRQDLVDGIRRLAEHDVDVYLAVRASDYLSVPVHDEWIATVGETAALVRREGLTNVRGIMGDAESPKGRRLDIVGMDRQAFFQAGHDLAGLIQWMHRGYPELRLAVTANWWLCLDGADGDVDLSILSQSSVDPPGGWDDINVMTYSSYIPSGYRAYYVYLIERAMARLDRRPSHLLGLAVPGNPGEPVLDFDELVRDARLSRALGVPEIVIYKLNERALDSFGHDFVQRLADAVNDTADDVMVRVPFSRPASMLVFGVALGDALLDAQGWKGLLFLGWMGLSAFVSFRSARYRFLGRQRYAGNHPRGPAGGRREAYRLRPTPGRRTGHPHHPRTGGV